jgi:hypothetical protein
VVNKELSMDLTEEVNIMQDGTKIANDFGC